MIRHLDVGLEQALELTLRRTCRLTTESVDLLNSVDRIAAEDLTAKVDSPSVDASLKDGYAVRSQDVASASPEASIRMKLTGCASAGGDQTIRLIAGTTIRILTGAKIPEGADAVVSEEFVQTAGEDMLFLNFAEPGRNILPRGSDVSCGEIMVKQGSKLTPGRVGILAAAGFSQVPVVKQPRVAIVGTGDEIVAPGQPLPQGKLYASNITALGGWCRRYGMQVSTELVKDEPDEIYQTLTRLSAENDALITSGGAWTGDRDMIARILQKMDWEQIFHRIRIGPGKAVGFGIVHQKPVFILPGGPPSNLMGFLQIALPGLLSLAGYESPSLPLSSVRLAQTITGRFSDWTQFILGMIERSSELPIFHPLNNVSRLHSMAQANAVAAIPEGQTEIPAGSVITVQLLD